MHVMGITGESAGLDHWDQIEMERGMRLIATGAQILMGHIPACSSIWAEILTRGSAHPQSQLQGLYGQGA